MSVLHVLHFYSLHQENPPPLVRTSFHKFSDLILVKRDLFRLLVQSKSRSAWEKVWAQGLHVYDKYVGRLSERLQMRYHQEVHREG
jgi:hypothetical protein